MIFLRIDILMPSRNRVCLILLLAVIAHLSIKIRIKVSLNCQYLTICSGKKRPKILYSECIEIPEDKHSGFPYFNGSEDVGNSGEITVVHFETL